MKTENSFGVQSTTIKRALLLYLGLALLIMLPMLKPGFVFLLDMIWGPQFELSDALRNGVSPQLPFWGIFAALSTFIPAEVIQKMVLAFVLVLPGISMYTLSKRFMTQGYAMGSGMLFMLNPFIFERFTAGQWLVLLGYGYFPLVIHLCLNALKKKDQRSWLTFSIAFACYPLLSLHWSYMAAGFLAVLFFVRWGTRTPATCANALTILKRVATIIGLFLLINSFWLFSFLKPSGTLGSIDTADFSAFATQADPTFGTFFNVLSLYGFWRSVFILPKDLFTGWWVITIIAMIFAILGAIILVRKRSLLGITAAICTLPVIMFAMGYGSDFTKPLVSLFTENLPFFSGLRDTAKLVGVIAFLYALFVPAGLQILAQLPAAVVRKPRLAAVTESLLRDGKTCITIAILLPLLWSGGLLFGAWGQMEAYAYPEDWYTAEEILSEDPTRENVLILPWSAYLHLDFIGGTEVANPARAFFTGDLVAGDNTDNPFLFAKEQSSWTAAVTGMLNGMETLEDHSALLQDDSISHIVLLKTDDWERYIPMLESETVIPILESEAINVYGM